MNTESTHHTKSPGPDMSIAPLIKKFVRFLNVLTSKWNVSKFELNRITSLQIIVFLVKIRLHIFKTIENSEFSMLIKHCFLIGKKYCSKQWLDKCYLDSAWLETMVKRWYADFKRGRTETNDAESSGDLNSAVILENAKKNKKTNSINSFWLIVN